MSKTMKSIRIHSYGGREQLKLEEIAIPSPQKGEVLVKVHAASVNPVDWKVREGMLAEILPHTLPLTLGWDFSGEIVALGENVSHYKLGDAVYSRPNIERDGSYAEYIVTNVNEIAEKPSSLDWQTAAAVPLVTLTAWQALYEIAQVQAKERILIHAGAGGVGLMAIQLAKLKGATVITTASAKNIDFLKAMGADEVIDYGRQDFSVLRDLDLVFDTMGSQTLAKSWQTLKAGGRLVSIVEPPDETLAARHKVSASFCFVQPSNEQLRDIAQLIDNDKLKVEIDSVYALEDIAKAHEKSESTHSRGKIVLQIA